MAIEEHSRGKDGKSRMYNYGLGYLGQGASYNFMSAYFVVFLTNCVGINSSLAGTISSLALLVEVMGGMIFGNLSDNCQSKMGKRRPFMLTAGLVVPVILLILSHTVHASAAATFAYYLFFAILFRVFFSCFEIPNNAFGSEISTGYDERTKQRTVCRWFSITGNGIGTIVPLLILDLFADNQEAGWQTVGAIIAMTTFGSWVGSFMLTKKYSHQYIRENTGRRKHNMLKNIFSNYLELIKLKPMKLLIIYKGAFACAFALYNIATLYFLQYALGLGNKYSSYIYAFTTAIFAIMTPVVDKMALKTGKANQQMYTMLVCGIAGVIIYLTAPNTLAGGVLYVSIFAVVQTGFWQLSNAIFYDVIEVDQYVNNKRRGGDIMSLVSVLGTLVTSVMVQLFGIFLDMSGFDPQLSAQPDSVVSFLDIGYILVPSLCCLAGFLALKAFPINKKTFSSLQKALALREQGESYDEYMDDINKLVK